MWRCRAALLDALERSKLTAANCTMSMVDACNDIGAAKINPLSAQIAGIVPGTCTILPSTATFENLFPYNPTPIESQFPNPATTTPSNNGLAKIDYSLNDHHHLDGFVFISRQSTSAAGALQPYWGTYGVGSTWNMPELGPGLRIRAG